MATNYVGEGKVIDYTAGGTISAGDVVVAGDTVGIALVDMVSGDVGAVAIEGVFTVAKTAGTAWAQGDAIGWDASASEFHKDPTLAAGDVALCGIAVVAAASAATTASLKLTNAGAAVT
jgi:predicted RecA/RadA family phage recombinase